MAKPHKYKIGDLVLLKDKSRYQSKCGKLAAPCEGPFTIVKLDPPNVYLCSHSQQEFQVHIDALSGLTKDFLEAGHTITSTRK